MKNSDKQIIYIALEHYEKKLKDELLHNKLDVTEIDRASKTLSRIIEMKKQMI